MWRRLVAISSFALATGLGMTSLTDTSASLAAAPDLPSGLAEQRVLVEDLQVAARARREEQAQAQAQAQAKAAAAAEADAAEQPPTKAPAPRTVSAPARRSVRLSVDWETLVSQYPWDVALARQVLWCESRGDPNAENAGANGLFQILGGPFDPTANVALAYEMYSARGWQPWHSSRTCWS